MRNVILSVKFWEKQARNFTLLGELVADFLGETDYEKKSSIDVNIQDIFTCMAIQTHPIIASQKRQLKYGRCDKTKLNII